MKRLLYLVLGLFLLASGCGTRTETSTITTANGKPEVALIMKSLANEFFKTMEQGAIAHQQAHADEYALSVNGIKDELDTSRQVALVDEMIAKGVDAIVIAPANSKALVAPLRRAAQAGIVVVNIDNRLDVDVLQQEGIEVPFVGPDNRAGARMVGDYLASRLEAGDAVAILEGVRGTDNAQQRLLGFQDAIESARLKVVDNQSAEWESTQAFTVAASMLSEHPEIKAILAANDDMAVGALNAVKAAGRSGEVQVVGFDNISAIRQAIREGRVLATADQYADQLAVFGIEYALKLIDDPDAVVDDRETPVDLVTAETLAATP